MTALKGAVAVVIANTTLEQPFAGIIEGTAFANVDRFGRSYSLYRVDQRSSPKTYTDPIDGEFLMEIRFFATEQDARVWVDGDIVRRGAH